ncbi:hypothetical protein OB955_05800 [Halobacteria archaeon AArc-m2/3/4]|uniref:Uncharacterized protein n=1 Tax=Natronoglomus mannanivorans TaxID=2979990 RepID=A0ABT2QBE0_9EURY|nr:hypothetical protein [Halobacteria archaeon AArc-m2/3/4]
MFDRVSELDTRSLWRIFVAASMVLGIVAAYVSTGDLLPSLVLGWLFAIAVAAVFTALISGVRHVRTRFAGERVEQ